MSTGFWIPGMSSGSQDDFVQRLRRKIEEFVSRRGHEEAVVELELIDGVRLKLYSISPEPGFGFLTVCPYPEDEERPWPRGEGDPVPPDEVILPVGTIKRITLNDAAERRGTFGFSLLSGD